MGCCASKRVNNNSKQKDESKNKKDYTNSDLKTIPKEEKSQPNIINEESPVKLPKKEEICDKCFYTNGEMCYCISIYKVKYLFDEKGKFKEQIQLSDEEFASIMRENGVNPDNFYVVTTNSE